MGTIVVADLQGRLSMDKRAFSEGIASARQDVAALHAELNDLATQIPQIGAHLGNLSNAHQQAAQMTQVARHLAAQPLPPISPVGPAPVNQDPHLQAAQGAQPIPGYGPGAGQGVASIPGLSGSLGPSFQGFQGMTQSQYGNLLAGNQTVASPGPAASASSASQPPGAIQSPAAQIQQMMALNPGLTPQMIASLNLGGVPVAPAYSAPHPAPAPSATPASPPPPVDTGLYPGVTPVVRGTPGTPTYLRTQAAQSESLNLARDFLQPLSPALTELLPAFISPVLAAGIAAGALGTALKSAADEATAYAAVEFRLGMAVRGTSLAPGGVNQGFLAQEQDRLRGLGIGGVQASGLEETAARYAKSPGQISGIDTMAMNLARRFGISPEQAQGMMTSMLSTGSTGQFTQYIPEIRDQESVAYTERMINQKTSGAAQAFMGTPAGSQAKLSADLEDVWTRFGTELLPIFQGITKEADDMMPALDTFLKFLGVVGTGLGDIGRVVGLPLDLLGKLVPGFDNLGKHMGDFFDFINDRSNRFLDFLDSQGNVTPMQRMTGLAYDANGDLGAPHSSFAGIDTTPGQWSFQQSQMEIAGQNLIPMSALPRYGTSVNGVPQGMPSLPTTGQTGVSALMGVGSGPNDPMDVTLPDGTTIHTTRAQWAASVAKTTSDFATPDQIAQAYMNRTLNTQGQIVTPPAKGGSGKPGIDNQLALDPSAIAKVAAMKTTQEEVSASVQAVKGVQDVFAELTTFHVDFTQVSDNLDNLQQAIVYLQQWWIAVATGSGRDTGLIQNQYGTTKTWLDMTDSMVTMMAGAMTMLNNIYKGADLMPSTGQTGAVVGRVSAMFTEVDAIAQAAFKNTGSGQQYVDMSQFQAWLQTGQLLMTLMGSGADILGKILTTPLPEPGQIKETARRAVAVLREVSTALSDAFVTNGQNSSMGLIIGGSGSKIDTGLLNAADLAGPGNTLLQFMGAGVGIFKSMVNFWVPSEGEIDQAVDRVMSITDKLAVSIERRMKAPQASQAALGNVMQAMGMPNIPGIMSAAGLGPGDQTYAAQAATATNMNAVLQPMLAGVQILQGMRNLSVPSEGEIKSVIGGTFIALDDAISMMPAPNSNDLAKMKAWGEAAGPAFGALNSAVQMLVAMRDLAVPTARQMGEFKSAAMTVWNGWASVMSMDPNTAAYITQGGQAMGAVFQAVSAGADSLNKIFNTPLPSPQEMSLFNSRLLSQQNVWASIAGSIPQHLTDQMGDWGRGAGAMFQAVSTGADYLAKIPALYVPTKDEMDRVFSATEYMSDRFTAVAARTPTELSKTMSEVGKAQSDQFAALNSGADLIAKVALVPTLSKDMIDSYFKNLDQFTEDYAAGMDSWVAKNSLQNAKYSKALGDELTSLVSGADFLSKIGTLRPDYTNAIAGYFGELTQVVNEFSERAGNWSVQVTPAVAATATRVKGVADALGTSMDALLKVPTASIIRSDQITSAFANVGIVISAFEGLKNRPDLQGAALTDTVKFASQMGEVFGAIKTTVESINLLNQPGQAEGAQTFGAAMNQFFMHSVGTYADEWLRQMDRMASGSENMSDRTYNAMAATPPGQLAGMKSVVVRQASSVAGGPGGSGGPGAGNTYNNCLIVNGEMIASDPDVAALIVKLTKQQNQKAGGLPTGSAGSR